MDDILLASNNFDILQETKEFLIQHFEMKDMGEATFVIGIEIHRDRKRRVLGLSQRAYIDKILERFWMLDYKPQGAPITKGDKLNKL